MKTRVKLFTVMVLIVCSMLFVSQAVAGTWTSLPSPNQSEAISSITTAHNGDIWAISIGSIYKFNGSSWQHISINIPGAGSAYILETSPDGLIYAYASINNFGKVIKWNGSGWDILSGDSGLTVVSAMEITSDGSIWLAGRDNVSQGRVVKRTASGVWEDKGVWSGGDSEILDVLEVNGEVWFAGRYYIASYGATGWINRTYNLNGLGYNYKSIEKDGNGNIYVYGYTYIYKLSGTTWENVSGGKEWYDYSGALQCSILIKSVDGNIIADNYFNNSIGRWLDVGKGINGNWSYFGLPTENYRRAYTIGIDGSIYAAGNYGYFSRYTGTLNIESIGSIGQTSVEVRYSYDNISIPAYANIIIQKSTDNVNFTDVQSISGTSFTVTGLQSGTKYYFRLKWFNESTKRWTYTKSLNVTTIPATITTSTSTVGGVSWSNNANIPGRSYAVLNWTPVAGASGYKVWIYDGYAWRMVQDIGNTTVWDSRVAKIFPSEATLDAITDNTATNNLFVTPTTGYDLPDNPWKLYKKTAGTTYDSGANYHFGVTAYNASGESPLVASNWPTLPDRTDTAAPTGTLVANDGAYNTTIKDVTLTITGSDTESGPYQISLSNDNVSWSAWEPFTTTKSWQITVGQGTKTIYLKIKDTAGNISNIISTTIFLKDDVTSPTISIVINNGAETTSSATVTLTLSAVDDGTSPDKLVQRFSNDGTTWSGWETATFTKTWDLASGADGQRVVYYQVKDAVGNIQTAGDTISLSTAASEPTGEEPTTQMSAGTVTINGVSYQITNSAQVSLRVNSPQNVAKARYSFDGITFSPWENVTVLSDAYSSYFAKDLTFSPGDGYRAMYMQFANSYGKESNITVNRYILDQTAPEFAISTLDGRTATNTGSVDLLITPKDNMSTTFKYSVNGGLEQALPTSNVITVSGLTQGKLNVIRIRLFDTAGNYTDKTFNIFYL